MVPPGWLFHFIPFVAAGRPHAARPPLLAGVKRLFLDSVNWLRYVASSIRKPPQLLDSYHTKLVTVTESANCNTFAHRQPSIACSVLTGSSSLHLATISAFVVLIGNPTKKTQI